MYEQIIVCSKVYTSVKQTVGPWEHAKGFVRVREGKNIYIKKRCGGGEDVFYKIKRCWMFSLSDNRNTIHRALLRLATPPNLIGPSV